MLPEGAFFIQLISNFMKKILFLTKFSFSCLLPRSSGNGGVKNKNKMLKNALILTGIKYVVQIGFLYHKKRLFEIFFKI